MKRSRQYALYENFTYPIIRVSKYFGINQVTFLVGGLCKPDLSGLKTPPTREEAYSCQKLYIPIIQGYSVLRISN